MSKIKEIQKLVRNGLYYLTEHADEEATSDGFDIYDIERALLNGQIRRKWLRDGKSEVVGPAWDNRFLGVVCRSTPSKKVRVITVYECD